MHKQEVEDYVVDYNMDNMANHKALQGFGWMK